MGSECPSTEPLISVGFTHFLKNRAEANNKTVVADARVGGRKGALMN